MRKLTALLTAVLLLAGLAVPALAAGDDEVEVRKIEMVFDAMTVRVNQNRTLYVEIYPHGATDRVVYWESSNPEVAVVDGDGIVTGISPGTAVITATSYVSYDKKRTATCLVTVSGTVLQGIETDADNASLPDAAVDGGEVLSAAKLRLDVEEAVKADKSGGVTTLTYKDKTTVSAAALRSAAFSAQYAGGTVRLKFQTLRESGGVQGQLTVTPTTKGDDEVDVKLGVYTENDRAKSTAETARSELGGAAAAVWLQQSGSYPVAVEVAAKVDLTGIDTAGLALYYRDSGGSYTPLADQSHRIDDNGFLHFHPERGGDVVIAQSK